MLPNLFKNITLSAVIGKIEYQSIFKLIKSSPYKSLITEARQYPKKHPIYEANKKSIPAYSPNACFNHIRSKETVKSLTGYIYCDFDMMVPASLLPTIPFIYASWLSFGGKGYGVLIKVDGLTLGNFDEVWLYLENYFLTNHALVIDPQTKDYSRQNVLSYDPDIYVNENVIPLDVNTIDLIPYKTFSYEDIVSKPDFDLFDLPVNYSNQIHTGYYQIKYQTVLEDYQGKSYLIIEDGKDYRNAFMFKTIDDGHRHRNLSSYAYGILYNNHKIGLKTFEKILLKANSQRCNPPLDETEVKHMAKSLIIKRDNKKLKIKTKKKCIWFNPESDLTLHDKQVIVGVEGGKLRKKKTLMKLIEVYQELQSKNATVTQKMLVKESGKSIRTVKSYWYEVITRCNMSL